MQLSAKMTRSLARDRRGPLLESPGLIGMQAAAGGGRGGPHKKVIKPTSEVGRETGEKRQGQQSDLK